MIEIVKDGESFDLYPDTRLTFILVSPLYVLDIGYNSHSFSARMPSTPKNRRLLDYADILLKSSYERSFLVDVKVGGVRLFRGYMEVSNASPITLDFEFSFLIDSASVAGQLKDTLFSEIDLGGTRSLSSLDQPGGVWRIAEDIPGGDAAIQVNGITYVTTWNGGEAEEDVLQELAVLINLDTANNGCSASVSGTGATAELTVEPNGTGPTATFFATTDINENEQIMLLQTYVSSGELTQQELAILAQTIATDPIGTHDYIFCPVKNERYYDALNPEYLGYVNLYDAAVGAFVRNESDTAKSHQTSWIPFPNVRYLLRQALAHIGLKDVSTFTDSSDFKQLHLWNNVSLDQANIDDDDNPFGLDGQVNWSKTSWDLTEHVPADMSPAELIKAISRIFNLAVVIDVQARTVDFLKRSDIISTSEVDWRDNTLSVYDINYRESKGWNYRHDKDEDDELMESGKAFAEIRQDKDGKEVVVNIPPLFEVTEADPINSETWKTAHISQVGYTGLFIGEPGNFSPRFFLFHGMQDDGFGDSYPMSSYTDTDQAGTSVGNYSLGWTGANGLYETFHQPWEIAQDADRWVSASMILSLTELLSINWKSPHRIRIREGEAKCLLKQVTIEVGMNAIRPARVELVPL